MFGRVCRTPANREKMKENGERMTGLLWNLTDSIKISIEIQLIRIEHIIDTSTSYQVPDVADVR